MIDSYSTPLTAAPNAAFMRGLFGFLASVVALLVLNSVLAPLLWVALFFVVMTGGLIWTLRTRIRRPRQLTLAADGVWIEGPTGRDRYDFANVTVFDLPNGSCALVKRGQRMSLPMLAAWRPESYDRPTVLERFRSAGIEVEARSRWSL